MDCSVTYVNDRLFAANNNKFEILIRSAEA